MLTLTPHQFDQDIGGFRSVAAKAGCKLAAADLIREYRMVNWAKLAPQQVHMSYWHEGQLRAFAGQNQRAIPLLLAGANPDSPDGFPFYAMATVAFLQRDLAGLKAARARLAALPEPSWFRGAKAEAGADVKVSWPPNLDVVDGLIICFDRSYSQAYGQCRKK